VPRRADRRGEEALVLDERAIERVGQGPRHRRSVTLDDDVEIATGAGLPTPGVAHEAAGDEGPSALARGHARDLGEQHARGRRQGFFESCANR